MLVKKENLFLYGVEIFEKAGVPSTEAKVVMEELVKSNLYGVDSHGVIRIPQYLEEIENGAIVPGAPIEVIRETPSTAIIDGNHNFGQLVGKKMVAVISEKAINSNVACGICLHSYHVGRLGAWTEYLAEQGLLAFAATAAYHSGPMAPWGASEGRLGTNPISFAAPRKNARPILMDFATTVVAEGKIRNYAQQNKSVPEGWIRDGYGRDTTNPMDFYNEPRGTILPIGGKTGGVKGSALGIMADIFSIALANTDYWTCLKKDELPEAENGLFLFAVNPDAFFGVEAFTEQCANHGAYIKSAKPAPGVKEVLLPGEFEYNNEKQRLENGIEIPDATWNGLVKIAQSLNCEWSASLERTTSDNHFLRY
ncbi:MAG: Ldh family oxidoreductase [Eubacteriales bacterium]|nr:Ldh family oxidoreductase [Eubacteriales bacterium]